MRGRTRKKKKKKKRGRRSALGLTDRRGIEEERKGIEFDKPTEFVFGIRPS